MKFKPQSLRSIVSFVNEVIKRWDSASQEDRESGDLVNPDEPIVLRVPNPLWNEGDDGQYEPDDEGNDTHLCFHLMSHGGGGDVDVDGNDCGHDGANFCGMEMEYDKFLSNGRRINHG